MKWRILIVGSLALESVKEISDEFVQFITARGAKVDRAEVVVDEKPEESVNLLYARDLAHAEKFVTPGPFGGVSAPAEPVVEPDSAAEAADPKNEVPPEPQPTAPVTPPSEVAAAPAPQPTAEPVTAAAVNADAPQAS